MLAGIAASGNMHAALDLLIYGTANAVLERRIARVGLIAVQGVRDTLEIGRRTRPRPYGFSTFSSRSSRAIDTPEEAALLWPDARR